MNNNAAILAIKSQWILKSSDASEDVQFAINI